MANWGDAANDGGPIGDWDDAANDGGPTSRAASPQRVSAGARDWLTDLITRALEFLNLRAARINVTDPPPALETTEWLPSGWKLAKEIDGGMSEGVHVIVSVDDKGCIKDRMVQKDTRFTSEHWFDRGERGKWYGPRNGTALERVPMEHHIQAMLGDLPGSESIAKVRRKPMIWRQENYSGIYRIYVEYCGHGDLNMLITNHDAGAALIPEAFVVQVAYSLVAAGLLMNRGYLDKQTRAWPEQVVHRE